MRATCSFPASSSLREARPWKLKPIILLLLTLLWLLFFFCIFASFVLQDVLNPLAESRGVAAANGDLGTTGRLPPGSGRRGRRCCQTIRPIDLIVVRVQSRARARLITCEKVVGI